jgi:ABC-type multidrug transport system ATPase subunit
MPALIEVNALRKRFGDIEALAGVSFHVAAGEIYGLLGPNGAGKSTTINILCGLISPRRGSARLSRCGASSAPRPFSLKLAGTISGPAPTPLTAGGTRPRLRLVRARG